MSNFVLVTGFGTGRRTARRVGDTIGECREGECRGFTYGEAEMGGRAFKRAIAEADECIGHSQGNDPLLRARPAHLTMVAPPIAHGRLRTASRLPLVVGDMISHPLELRRLEILGSGLGEMMIRGTVYSRTFLRDRIGRAMLEDVLAARADGTRTTIAQMAHDEIIPVLDELEVEGIDHMVVDGKHNALLIHTERVIQQLPLAA
jgi:hypothetical protein